MSILNIPKRVLEQELMDDPQLEATHHIKALTGLGRINRFTNNATLFWHPLKEIQQRTKKKCLHILDIASGGGDVPLQLALKARKHDFTLKLTLTDISQQALTFAKNQCLKHNVAVECHLMNAVHDMIEHAYDLVICSQFLHHLPDNHAYALLQKMKNAAFHRVIVVDLIRSWHNLIQVWLATRVLTRSSIVHFDGPQSVRAAFSLQEIHTMIDRLAFPQMTLSTHWPCRFRLLIDK